MDDNVKSHEEIKEWIEKLYSENGYFTTVVCMPAKKNPSAYSHTSYQVKVTVYLEAEKKYVIGHYYFNLFTPGFDCGNLLLEGFSSFKINYESSIRSYHTKSNEEIKEIADQLYKLALEVFNAVVDNYGNPDNYGPGVIIAFLGGTDKYAENSNNLTTLSDLGFQELIKYNNHAHGADYPQRLFAKVI